MGITLLPQVAPVDYEAPENQTCVSSGSLATTCATCPANELSICAAVSRSVAKGPRNFGGALLATTVHTVPARKTICFPSDWSDNVQIVCQGWAISSLTLSDGRRQILSFLLAGDMFSPVGPFASAPGRSVEAITDVTYRSFNRTQFKTILFQHPEVMETLSKVWIDERWRADQLALDLGRRTADERIARLILSLRERLEKRNLTQNQTMEFPLRQHHIADATGLTPVHVNKVLSDFRRSGLIEISNRTLTILDLEEFRRVAGMR